MEANRIAKFVGFSGKPIQTCIDVDVLPALSHAAELQKKGLTVFEGMIKDETRKILRCWVGPYC